MSFATRLRELRERGGLTQAQLAERAGMHTLTVAKLEQELRLPSWTTVQALARALGVNCAAFEEHNGAPTPRRRPGRPSKLPGGTREAKKPPRKRK